MSLKLTSYEASSFKTSWNEDDVLGSGSFSTVRRCIHDELGEVAAKCLFVTGSEAKQKKYNEDVHRELNIHCRMQHKNIVKYFGVTKWNNYTAVIMEYIDGGNLEDLLYGFNDVKEIPWLLRFRIYFETADGVWYMHYGDTQKSFIHCDLKSQNVLLTSDLTVKIADFGGVNITKRTGAATLSLNVAPSTQHSELYTAPELLKNYSDSSLERKPSMDVYSFGMIGYEIITRKRVYHGAKSPGIVPNLIRSLGLRPDQKLLDLAESKLLNNQEDFHIFKCMKSIVTQCWDKNPEKRPNMQEVLEKISKQMSDYNDTNIVYHLDDLKASGNTQASRTSTKIKLSEFSQPFRQGCKVLPAEVAASEDESPISTDLPSTSRAPDRVEELSLRVNTHQMIETKALRIGNKIQSNTTVKDDKKFYPLFVTDSQLMNITEEAVSLVVEPATAETVIAADVCQEIKGNSEEEKSNKILIVPPTSINGEEPEEDNKAKVDFLEELICICFVLLYLVTGYYGVLILKIPPDEKISSGGKNSTEHYTNESSSIVPSVILTFDSRILLGVVGFFLTIFSFFNCAYLKIGRHLFSESLTPYLQKKRSGQAGIINFLQKCRPQRLRVFVAGLSQKQSFLMYLMLVACLIISLSGVFFIAISVERGISSNTNTINDNTTLTIVGVLLVIASVTGIAFSIYLLLKWVSIGRIKMGVKNIIQTCGFLKGCFCLTPLVMCAVAIIFFIVVGVPLLIYVVMGNAVCSGTYNITNNKTSLVASPGFTNNTDYNLECTYIFHAQPGYTVELIFEVDVEPCCARLDIYDGEKFVMNLTGKIPHTDVLSNEQFLKLLYIIDYANVDHRVASKGFWARYRQFSCGGHYEITNRTTSVLTSPNYPNNKKYNFQCTYTFHAQLHHIVELTMEVDTEPCCASIEVYDGEILLKTLDGKDHQNVKSTGQSLKLVYISDYTNSNLKVASKGFWAEYKQSKYVNVTGMG
ncbi:uncharacterized protein LOC143451850 isoform X2 [Clavelina lepadiformis]|uniref:uncharacterized protein LOC143451850 isoform X2 n=1 Tax=Clavelina lepadiformis TaxID=159417 RepID=UPI00404258AB